MRPWYLLEPEYDEEIYFDRYRSKDIEEEYDEDIGVCMYCGSDELCDCDEETAEAVEDVKSGKLGMTIHEYIDDNGGTSDDSI